MLPSEIPYVIYEGSGDRGPFSLSVDGTPISYADKSHIRVTRFDGATITLLIEGTDYQLSANSALPDLGDPLRVVTTATLTLKVIQPVLDAGQFLLIERIAPPTQDLAYTQAGGFSSSSNERNLDAIVRVVQQIVNSLGRVFTINRLDEAGVLEVPSASDRAGKIFSFDDDGLPSMLSIDPGIGDLLSDNNLSDLDDAATARTNLGLGSAAIKSESYFLRAANNLSDLDDAATARSSLGLGSAAILASTAILQVANNLSDIGNAATARSNLGLTSAAVATLDTDGTLAANSDTRIASQKATKTYVDAAISAIRNGVAAAYDTLAEIVTAFASIGPVTKSVVETGSAVALTTDTPTNVTSITIPEDGTYDLWGAVHFKGGSSRTIGYLLCSISSSSATLNTAAERGAAFYYNGAAVFAGVGFITVPLQEFRLTGLTAGTVIYLVPQAGFGGSGTTVSAYGTIYARKRGL